MNNYSLVYLGPFDRAPFFGGTFWFDKDVPQAVRGDLAAQLLFTKQTDGSQQFQLASEADFNGMLFDGFIAAGTAVDGLVWAGGSRAVDPLLPPDGAGDPSQAKAAILGDAPPADETNSGNGETNGATVGTGDAGGDAGSDASGDAGTDAAGDSTQATPKSTGRRARSTGAQA